jgi:hypothetical protein
MVFLIGMLGYLLSVCLTVIEVALLRRRPGFK